MSQFIRLSNDEILDLYAPAANFVKTHMRNSDSPNMVLAPFEKRQIGQTHLTVPIYGANSLRKNKHLFELLEDTFGIDINGEPPSIYDEIQADGTGIVYKLNLPISFKNTQQVVGGNGGNGKRLASKTVKPTLEWPLFLLLVEVVLCGSMYYRYSVGSAF